MGRHHDKEQLRKAQRWADQRKQDKADRNDDTSDDSDKGKRKASARDTPPTTPRNNNAQGGKDSHHSSTVSDSDDEEGPATPPTPPEAGGTASATTARKDDAYEASALGLTPRNDDARGKEEPQPVKRRKVLEFLKQVRRMPDAVNAAVLEHSTAAVTSRMDCLTDYSFTQEQLEERQRREDNHNDKMRELTVKTHRLHYGMQMCIFLRKEILECPTHQYTMRSIFIDACATLEEDLRGEASDDEEEEQEGGSDDDSRGSLTAEDLKKGPAEASDDEEEEQEGGSDDNSRGSLTAEDLEKGPAASASAKVNE